LKELVNDGFSSIFIEPNEMKYVRIDTKDNLVIAFKDPPLTINGRPTFGFRVKLIADPTARSPTAKLNFYLVDEEESKEEKRLVQEGKFSGILRDIVL
jgi:hypothetical protein